MTMGSVVVVVGIAFLVVAAIVAVRIVAAVDVVKQISNPACNNN
jgi:hypothetical protein